ncbi:MAG: hypothetical protein ACTSUE_07600 [Promethearchaeota archaeon]
MPLTLLPQRSESPRSSEPTRCTYSNPYTPPEPPRYRCELPSGVYQLDMRMEDYGFIEQMIIKNGELALDAWTSSVETVMRLFAKKVITESKKRLFAESQKNGFRFNSFRYDSYNSASAVLYTKLCAIVETVTLQLVYEMDKEVKQTLEVIEHISVPVHDNNLESHHNDCWFCLKGSTCHNCESCCYSTPTSKCLNPSFEMVQLSCCSTHIHKGCLAGVIMNNKDSRCSCGRPYSLMLNKIPKSETVCSL